jgi:hypothetical protein
MLCVVFIILYGSIECVFIENIKNNLTNNYQMPNNFKIQGDVYVSKSGSDTFDGLTPNTPKATIAAACNLQKDSLVIGEGTYEDTGGRITNMAADGIVVILGNGTNAFEIHNASGLRIQNSSITSPQYGASYLINCYFKNCQFYLGTQWNFNFTKCVFINCVFGSEGVYSFMECVFINTSTASNNVHVLMSSYEGSGCTLGMFPFDQNTQFDYNNINGLINVTGGTQNPYTLGLLKSQFPAYNAHSVNVDPQFNGSQYEDFTLKSTSPHIGAGAAGVNIGGTAYARSLSVKESTEWQTTNGAVLDHLEFSGDDLIVTEPGIGGYHYGTITSAPILLSSTAPVAIGNFNYNGLLLFNNSQPGGSSTNKNVPDAKVYPKNDEKGGDSPDRLVFEVRTSSAVTPNVHTDTDWDNNFPGLAGSWIKVPVSGAPLIDEAGKGNGEPDFNVLQSAALQGNWIQLRYTLTNAYYA